MEISTAPDSSSFHFLLGSPANSTPEMNSIADMIGEKVENVTVPEVELGTVLVVTETLSSDDDYFYLQRGTGIDGENPEKEPVFAFLSFPFSLTE